MKKRKFLVTVIVSLFVLFNINDIYSVSKKEQIKWFKDAKFGMFIHWGVYSMLGMQEWIRHEARIPLNEYQFYVDNFNPVNYEPDKWVKLAKESGMKYIVFTSKHHDGFCMYDSKQTDYDIINTKYGKDVMMMLKNSCEKYDMQLGIYYSNPDWHHPDYHPKLEWEAESRLSEKSDMDSYIMDYEIKQLEEIVKNYNPFLLWFDLGAILKIKYEHSAAIEKALRSLKPELLINNRLYYKRPEMADFITPERRVPATGLKKPDGSPYVWEVCNAIDYTSWGYNPYSNYYHSYPELIHTLIDIVSKGGNLLLNVGPRPDGTISFEYEGRLKEIGKWLKVNGEAIYGTTASCFENLPFYGKCTVKGNTLYFHVMGWPVDKTLHIPGLETEIKQVSLLTNPDNLLKFEKVDNDYYVTLPERAPDEIATVVKVELYNPPIVKQSLIEADKSGNVNLPIYMANFNRTSGASGAYIIHCYRYTFLENWHKIGDIPGWVFTTDTNANYEVRLSYAVARDGGGEFKIIIDGNELSGTVEDKGRSNHFYPLSASIGHIDLPSGKHNLQIKVISAINNNLMRLEKVELIKKE